VSWIVTSPDGVPLDLSTDQFSRAVEVAWPGQWTDLGRRATR
jgi:hypothetical protein